LPLLDEPSLHLSYHPEHGQHDATGFATRGDVRVEHGNEGLSLIALTSVHGDPPQPFPDLGRLTNLPPQSVP
jgi:hypothetical protein